MQFIYYEFYIRKIKTFDFICYYNIVIPLIYIEEILTCFILKNYLFFYEILKQAF